MDPPPSQPGDGEGTRTHPADGDAGGSGGDGKTGTANAQAQGGTDSSGGGINALALAGASSDNLDTSRLLPLPAAAPYLNPALSTSPFLGAQFSPFLGAQFGLTPQEQLWLPPASTIQAQAQAQAQAHAQSLLAQQLQLEQLHHQQRQLQQPPPRKAPRRNTEHDRAAAADFDLGDGDPAATAALVASLFDADAADPAGASALAAAFPLSIGQDAMSPGTEMDVERAAAVSAAAAALETAPETLASNAAYTLPSRTTSQPALASLNAMPQSQMSMSLPTSLSSAPVPPITASLPQVMQPQGQVRHNAALTSAMNPPHLSQDAVLCVTCGFAGADVRINCIAGKKCAYHARCIDLVTLCANAHQQPGQGGKRQNDSVVVKTCPNCHGAANGLEIIPLSFAELDRAQRQGMQKKGLLLGAVSQLAQNAGGGSTDASAETGKKRSSSDMDPGATGGASYPGNIAQACRATNPTSVPPQQSGVGMSSSQCYDPAVPRTGRWTDEELAFRDAIIANFLEGAFPLSNGLKLNDFLSNMLKSKQSRLTKKMKHAKLSTKYFRIKAGHISPVQKAKEFSSLEYNFVNVIADPIERSEIQFHMQKEWRDHLAERCTYLRIMFDAEEWLKSVDTMDRRVALEKNRSRMAKRRCLIGKAMEKDVSDSLPGVFINQGADRKDDFLLDMEAKQQAASNNAGDGDGNGDDDGDFGRFLMSMLDEAPMSANPPTAAPLAAPVGKKEKERSSYTDPNFRYAAPFLAGITSYLERHGVPFEHVDVWVPSTVPQALESETTAPMIGSMGSGSSTNLTAMGGTGSDGSRGGVTRLCFAGSATLGVQIVDESSSSEESRSNDATKKIVPLTSDEVFNFSLYGDYSEKFSFSSGCGLPGRVFASGGAAWEQFLANAPAEMFERRGGAIQFGIKTALGLPIDSPNVGRIVLVLYSIHNREKDEELVQRLVKDMKLFNPCPRWKLVVDVRSTSSSVAPSPVAAQPPLVAAPHPAQAQSIGMARSHSASFNAGMSQLSVQPVQQQNVPTNSGPNTDSSGGKEKQTVNLIALLQENMPSDASTSPLGQRLNSIMSLRMILLRVNNRTPEEEQLVDTILVLYESYLAAGRSRIDIALLVTRDFEFHVEHMSRMAALSQPQPSGIGGALAGPQQNLLQAQGVGPMVAQGFHPQQQAIPPAPPFPPAMQSAAHPFLQQPGLALQQPGMHPNSAGMQPMDIGAGTQPSSSAAAPNSQSGTADES